jgi:hypothetical protein
MKKLIIALCFALTASFLQAQWLGSANVAIGSGAAMGTLGIEYDWTPLGDKIHINPGLRINGFSGSNIDYLTAPANLTGDEANMDTIGFGSTSPIFINLFLRLQYDITDRFNLGFDIGLVGVSFGPEVNGTYLPGANAQTENRLPQVVNAAPTTINALLVGDNDLGSLNSTLYLGYNISERLGVNLGAGWVFTEYTTTTGVGVMDNNRFRNKNMMGSVGVTYAFGG